MAGMDIVKRDGHLEDSTLNICKTGKQMKKKDQSVVAVTVKLCGNVLVQPLLHCPRGVGRDAALPS